MFRNPVTDLIVVAVVALLIFGPKRLPMLGRSLGQGLKEFKEGITGERKADEDEERPALEAATATEGSREPAAATAPTPAPSAPAAERESTEAGSSELRS